MPTSRPLIKKKLPSDLHYLFQKSLHNGKVLRSKFRLDQKMPTLSKMIAHQIGKKRVLVVGNSKIGRQCILALKRVGSTDITLATRYPKNIQEQLLPWNQLFLWPTFDIVIGASKTHTPILLKSDYYENAPIQKIYDLGVPRNSEVLPITVLDIDQLGQIVEQRRLNQTSYVKIGEEKIREIVSRQFGLAKMRENRDVYSGGLNLGKEGRKIRSRCKADDELDSIESSEEDNAAGGDEFLSKIFQIQIG